MATGCEAVVVADVNAARSAAGLPALPTAEDLSLAARAHSVEICSARRVAPADDPAASYLGVAATDVDELVGAALLDPGLPAGSERNAAAAAEIWAGWADDPTLVDPRWEAIGVGEHTCDDGRLYSTLLLRDAPPALDAPADTSRIVLAETLTEGGWRYERYRNLAAPCAISGFQSFVVGTRVGSSATAVRPLWVKLRGGGAGWFGPDGSPLPTAGVKSEESLATQLGYDTPGLMAEVKAAPEGFRTLIVSMCSHDVYGGNDGYDPYNPNRVDGGRRRPTTGLTATKAAVQHTTAAYPTDDTFLHGTSAGGVGVPHVAWALQRQGIPPAGIISDAGILNQDWQRWVAENGIPGGSAGCEKATEDRGFGLLGRIDREVGDPANEPHDLVASGRLTVPVAHVWNINDQNQCGDTPIPCPLPDGTTRTMGVADCNHEPLRIAIDALPAGTPSINVRVCVEGGDATLPCDRHVVTTRAANVNTDPGQPADFQAALLAWVRDRLADD